jgi:carboxylesterase type B
MASSSRQQLPTPFELHHEGLKTTFSGVEHALSTPAASITQFRGVRYAIIPGRFRTARLVSEYEEVVDATCYGYVLIPVYFWPHVLTFAPSPVCPQSEPQYASMSDDGVSPADPLTQDELDCLNLTITCPRPKDSESPHPVMVWIHGYVLP